MSEKDTAAHELDYDELVSGSGSSVTEIKQQAPARHLARKQHDSENRWPPLQVVTGVLLLISGEALAALGLTVLIPVPPWVCWMFAGMAAAGAIGVFVILMMLLIPNISQARQDREDGLR